MRPLAAPSLLLVASIAVTARAQTPPAAPPALVWQHDWKSALAKATAESKPILVVVVKEREPACPRMFEKVYADGDVAAKLANFVLVPCCEDGHAQVEDAQKHATCARFRGVLCTEHQAIERLLHERFADATNGEIVVPLHVVCDIAGNVLLRHPWEMKHDAFLEFLETGLSLFKDPGAKEPNAAKSARSPAVEKLVDAILRAKGDDAREQAVKDLLSESTAERDAAYLDAIARLKAPADKADAIRAAGRAELKSAAPTLAKLLDEKDPFLRDCAVVTLEEQGSPAVAATLLAQWGREKDGEVRKDLLRAMGPCGGGNGDVKKLLLAELADPKESLRAGAACSLGCFVKGDAEVAAALAARYAKEKSLAVQVGVLWGLGASEDEGQQSLVDQLVAKEKNADLLKLAALVKKRLTSSLDKVTFGHGKGNRAEIHHLIAPLVDGDKVEREYVKQLDRTSPK